MSKLSTEAKQAIIEKVLSKDGRTIREIAESYNVGYSTPVASKVNVTEELIRCLINDVTEQRQSLIKYPLQIS